MQRHLWGESTSPEKQKIIVARFFFINRDSMLQFFTWLLTCSDKLVIQRLTICSINYIVVLKCFAILLNVNFQECFCRPVVKSFIQGFLPGIALKIFLILLPSILMTMSKIEGYTSLSTLERRSAAKYYRFIFVNVFLVSIITGTALQQLQTFIHQSADEYVTFSLYLTRCMWNFQDLNV